MIIEVTPDGGSNWYTVKTRHDGSMATNAGTYCSFRTSGEISFGWPKESEWGSSTINSVTGWWLSMRFVDDAGTPYLLEVNTLPGMTETSLLPEIARGVGIAFEDLVEAIVNAARGRGA